MKVDDTLAAINALVDQCAGCGRDLGKSPSGYFCSQDCQARWMRARTANPDEVLGRENEPHRDVPAGRVRPRQDAAFPPVQECRHCGEPIRRFPTIHGRTQVVDARPDPERGNIRWLPSERRCIQVGPGVAAGYRLGGLPMFVFHGLVCAETLARSSSTPRPRAGERPGPPADETTRQQAREQVAERLGWRTRGSWWSRRRRW